MIYIIPFPLIDNEEIDVNKKTRGFKLINAPSFWYLHGALQEQFGFDGAYMWVDYDTWKTDKVQFINNRAYLAQGIHDVVVEGCDKPCRAYIWHQKVENNVLMRGIVIRIATDKDGLNDLEYAVKLFNEKPFTF